MAKLPYKKEDAFADQVNYLAIWFKNNPLKLTEDIIECSSVLAVI